MQQCQYVEANRICGKSRVRGHVRRWLVHSCRQQQHRASRFLAQTFHLSTLFHRWHQASVVVSSFRDSTYWYLTRLAVRHFKQWRQSHLLSQQQRHMLGIYYPRLGLFSHWRKSVRGIRQHRLASKMAKSHQLVRGWQAWHHARLQHAMALVALTQGFNTWMRRLKARQRHRHLLIVTAATNRRFRGCRGWINWLTHHRHRQRDFEALQGWRQRRGVRQWLAYTRHQHRNNTLKQEADQWKMRRFFRRWQQRGPVLTSIALSWYKSQVGDSSKRS